MAKAQLFATGALAGMVLFGAGSIAWQLWRVIAEANAGLGRFVAFVTWCVFCGYLNARGKK